MTSRLSPGLKLLLDFAPLGAFFVGYKIGDIRSATIMLIAVTAASLGIIYTAERRIARAPLVSGLLVAMLGGLTLYLDDPLFIKVKPTVLNLLFAVALLGGVFIGRRGLLRYVLDVAFRLSDRGWLILSRRWGFFFLFLAVLNEVIWRNFPLEFWVNFKVFGMFTLTIAFALAQWRLIARHAQEE